MNLKGLCFCLGSALLFLSSEVDAQIGAPEEILPSKYHFLLHVDYELGSQSFMGILVSSNFVMTSSSYLTAYQNDTKVYSGNFLDSSARQTHTVKNVTTNGIVSLLQICPSVAWMVNEPVTFNFDYVEPLFENITAEVIYFDRTAMKLFQRNETVLTDTECTDSNTQPMSTQEQTNYTSPDMTCTQFDNAENGCKYVRGGGANITCFPIVVFDSDPLAIFNDVKCSGGKMTSIATYISIYNQMNYIFNSTDADLESTAYDDIVRRRARKSRRRQKN